MSGSDIELDDVDLEVEEEEQPKKKGKGKAPAVKKAASEVEEEEEESSPAPKSKGKGKGKKQVSDDEEEPAPKPAKGKGKGKKQVSEEEEDEEPAPKKGKKAATTDEDEDDPVPKKGKGAAKTKAKAFDFEELKKILDELETDEDVPAGATKKIKQIKNMIMPLEKKLTTKRRKSSNRDVEMKLSPELCKFLGVDKGTQMTRSEVQHALNTYVHYDTKKPKEGQEKWAQLNKGGKRDLQYTKDKKRIKLDEALKKLTRFSEHESEFKDGKKTKYVKDVIAYSSLISLVAKEHMTKIDDDAKAKVPAEKKRAKKKDDDEDEEEEQEEDE